MEGGIGVVSNLIIERATSRLWSMKLSVLDLPLLCSSKSPAPFEGRLSRPDVLKSSVVDQSHLEESERT